MKNSPAIPPQSDAYPRGLRIAAIICLTTYWLALFSSTHVPRMPKVIEAFQWFDKCCHFVGFGILAWFASWAWMSRFPKRTPVRLVDAATILVPLALYGMFDELTQPLVGRSRELADWIADLLGATTGVSLFAAWRTMLGRKRANGKSAPTSATATVADYA